MSGGAFDYNQETLAHSMYGWGMDVGYGEAGHKLSRAARKLNPMHDRELSELVWDVLCLVHSLDWCDSGDTGEDCYQADVKWFKEKWFGRTPEAIAEAYKQDIRDYVDEIIGEIELLEKIQKRRTE